MKIQSLISDVIQKLDPDFLLIQNDGTEWSPEELVDDIQNDLEDDPTCWPGDYDLRGEQIVELENDLITRVIFDLKFQIKLVFLRNSEFSRENDFHDLPHFLTDEQILYLADKIVTQAGSAGFICEPANIGGYNEWNGYQFFEKRCGMFATKQKLSDEQWQVFCDAYYEAIQKEVDEFYSSYDLTCKTCGADIDSNEFWEEFPDGTCNNEVCQNCVQNIDLEEIEEKLEPKIKIDLTRFSELETYFYGFLDEIRESKSVSIRIRQALTQESDSVLATEMEIELLKRFVLNSMLANFEFFTTTGTLGEVKRTFIDNEQIRTITQQNDLGNYLQELIERSYV